MFLIYFHTISNNYCENLKLLITLTNNTKIKYKYKKFHLSNTYSKIKSLLKQRKSHLATENCLIKSKDFLLTVSKFIDYKINFNKTTYRTKSNETIIENFSRIIALNIHKDNPYILFNQYNKYYNTLQIKLKENKMFKILLSRFLLEEFIKIKKEVIKISNIIRIYKKRNFIFNYRKNIYNYAKYYAILKFNNNAYFYKCKNNIDNDDVLNKLFSYLFESENKLKIITTYLKTMF